MSCWGVVCLQHHVPAVESATEAYLTEVGANPDVAHRDLGSVSTARIDDSRPHVSVSWPDPVHATRSPYGLESFDVLIALAGAITAAVTALCFSVHRENHHEAREGQKNFSSHRTSPFQEPAEAGLAVESRGPSPNSAGVSASEPHTTMREASRVPEIEKPFNMLIRLRLGSFWLG